MSNPDNEQEHANQQPRSTVSVYLHQHFVPDEDVEMEPQENGTTSANTKRLEAFRVAAVLIRDSQSGQWLKHKNDKKSIRIYAVYENIILRYLSFLALAILFLLFIIESPATEEMKAPLWVSVPLELLALGYIVFRFVHNACFSLKRYFFQDKKNIVMLITLSLMAIDIVIYLILIHIPSTAPYARRWTRVLRPMIMINLPQMYQLRRALRNLRKTLISILPVVALFIFFICLYSLLGLKLIGHHVQKKDYFDNYLNTIWDLFVLLTTANNPDIMLPAYDLSRWFALFFVSYMLINYILISNILLAVIYNSYRDNLIKEVRGSIEVRRKLLTKAFDLVAVDSDGRKVIDRPTWTSLLTQYSPQYSSQRIKILFNILREDSGVIDLKRFLKLADLLNIQIKEKNDSRVWCELKIPSLYNSRVSKAIRFAVRHILFTYAFHAMILVNALCIALDVDEAEWFFMSVFVVEIVLKLYALGIRRFISSWWNIFDFILIFSALILTICRLSLANKNFTEHVEDTLLVLRVLRLLKVAGPINKFRTIITTIFQLSTSMGSYTLLVWVFFYPYAILGMELFAGSYSPDSNSTHCGNSLLNGTDFAELNYCSVNFNDAVSACLTLYNLLIVNQWHVITSGLVDVTTQWAKLFTFTFVLIFTFLILNIVVAFIIEAFMVQFKMNEGSFRNDIEAKIREASSLVEDEDDHELSRETVISYDFSRMLTEATRSDSGEVDSSTRSSPRSSVIQFRLKNNSAKRTEVLLQQMFECELEEDL